MRHGKSPHLFRLAQPRYRPAVARPHADILEDAVLFAIGEVERCRKAKLLKLDSRRGVHQCDQLTRLRILERLEQHALDDGEDGRAGSDAQAQGQDADRREAPIPGQPSGGIAQIAEESIYGVLPSIPANLFVHGNRAAEFQPGRAERLVRWESLGGKGRRRFSQVVSDFIGDFPVRRFSVKEAAQAALDLAEQRHSLSLGLQQARDRRRAPAPVGHFNLELFPPGASQPIELRPARILGLPPL